MTALPAGSAGEIRLTLTRDQGDGTTVPHSGYVTLRPNLKSGTRYHATGVDPIVAAPVDLPLDSQGRIRDQSGTGWPKALRSDAPGHSIPGMQYLLEYHLDNLNGQPPADLFTLNAAAVDIRLIVNPTPQPGIVVVVSEQTKIDAQEAAAAAETFERGAQLFADAAKIYRDQASLIALGDADATLATAMRTLGSKVSGALGELVAPRSPAAPLAQIDKARKGRFIACSIGHSLQATSFGNHASLGEYGKNLFGDAGDGILKFGQMGGNGVDPFLGWQKISYPGPGYRGLVGTSASTSDLEFWFYIDTLSLVMGREDDSVAADILIDDVVVGQTPAAGAQSYTERQTFKVTRGYHKITIRKPTGEGRVYLYNGRAFDSTRVGWVFLDDALGSTSLSQMINPPIVNSPNLPAKPVVGENGIVAQFDRPEVDLFMIGADVNDWERWETGEFQLVATRAAAITKKNGAQILWTLSMMGGYADPAHAANTKAKALRAWVKDLAAKNPHITVVDWHAATEMTDLVAYRARYYPGDFIHPGAVPGCLTAQQLTYKTVGVPPARQSGANAIAQARFREGLIQSGARGRYKVTDSLDIITEKFKIDQNTAKFITPKPHGLAVGDRIRPSGGLPGFANWDASTVNYVVAVLSATEFQTSLTEGGAVRQMPTGPDYNARIYRVVARSLSKPVGTVMHIHHGGQQLSGGLGTFGRPAPLFREAGVPNFLRAEQAKIDASSTVDPKHGPYLDLNGANYYPNEMGSAVGTLALKVAGNITVRAADRFEFLTPEEGTVWAAGGTARNQFALAGQDVTDEPYWIAITARLISGGYFAIPNGRVFEISLTPGKLAVIGE